MATFTYKAKDRKGEVIIGALEADSPSMVVSRLQSMGYFPLQVESEKGKKTLALGGLGRALARGRASAADLATFNRQMADLISSGIPLVKSLDIVGSQTAKAGMREIVQSIGDDVTSGDTLAEAMERHPRYFNAMAVAMVRAGETGGMLEGVLERLADFAEAEDDLRSKVKSALAYPAVMVFAGAGAITLMVSVVIPKIARVYADLEQSLPGPTLALMAVTSFFAHWWLALLAGGAALSYAAWGFWRTREGRRLADFGLLRIPILGEVILKREVSRYARTLGELVRNGVPILSSLRIAEQVLSNRVVLAEVEAVPDAISEGSTVASALKNSKHFPPIVINMVAIGEETGRLPESLLKIASTYETQVDRQIKTLTSLLEPLIILVMGLIVGAIVIAMVLPIFSLDPTGGS